jgi:hypothetical protein
MIKLIVGFSLKLMALLAIVFFIHTQIVSTFEMDLFGNRIILSYVVNYAMAILIFIGLLKLKEKHLDILGFVYMGGSMLKFTIFFIFFNPYYREDGIVDSFEAFAFLTPYLICLIIETFYLIKLLNNKL